MNKQEAVVFLFSIAKEIKRSLQRPVILMTMEDYADCIFNSLVEMRTALLQQAGPDRVVSIITTFHLKWLQAVQDVENFKKRIKELPRDVLVKAIDYTKESVKNRVNYFQKFIDTEQSTMTADERKLLQADIETIGDMQENVYSVLREKQICLQSYADHMEYHQKITDEIEELMDWLDTLSDHLAAQFSEVVGLKFPRLTSDLTKTLKDIIDAVAASSDTEAQGIALELQGRREKLSWLGRLAIDDIEIRKVIEKIKVLKNRIDRLRNEQSSAVVALEHKTLYLEERLSSLEELKMSLYTLKNKQTDADKASCKELYIFDHLLPAQERVRLVEQLIKLWNAAICCGNDAQSIISILSVADLKETFLDDFGTYTVDKYGRKLYKLDEDDTLYQLNERNQFVHINDNESHIFYYDNCGRYYLTENNERVYKRHENASEYIIDSDVRMAKIREEVGNEIFWYDTIGRYYVNEYGKRIYTNQETGEEYHRDGLGNLVRVRKEVPIHEMCPMDPVVLEESKYLQRTVGEALKKCLADVVLKQPKDPIAYLSESLIKYRTNMQMHQKRNEDEKEMMKERTLFIEEENYKKEQSAVVLPYTCEDEETPYDYSVINYATKNF